MTPIVAVLQMSDSFVDLWARLAATAGADVRRGRSLAEVGSLADACGLLVAAGGVEADAFGVLQEAAVREGPPAVVVGAETEHRLPVALVRAGAADYFALPAELSGVRSWMVECAERVLRADRVEELARAQRARFDFSRMVGESPAFRAALERASRVIPRGAATVLITGETGTGKDLLAQAVHYNGPRARGPFVEVNCAALPATLLEAELFGYEKGAFTDARTAKPGLFEAAHGGTLFLDEIGDLSAELQAKLLRVLEAKRVRRLGSVRDQEVDVRIIAATHVDLPARVRQGAFRRDLFYRLSVVPVELPSLRDRGDDVLMLTRHFLERFGREYDVPPPALTPEIRGALLAHPWPGNVRELKNSIERAVLLGDGMLKREDLFLDLGAGLAPATGPIPFPATLDEVMRAAARAMTERCGGNKSEAARLLGIGRRHLYSLLESGAGGRGQGRGTDGDGGR
ncbi:MAG: sigma-54 dependent transcriptional regulator [Longimicrobiaceae bacterium]